MNIINKLTLRHMKLNRKRTIVTMFGIIIAVAMITSVSTFIYSFMDYLARDEMADHGRFHLKFENYQYSDNDELMEEMNIENYSLMKPVSDYYYKWNWEEENAVIEQYVPDVSGTKPNEAFRIVAVQDNYYDMMAIRLMEGDYPKSENELLLPMEVLGDKEVGDKLIIGSKDYTICGITSGNEFEHRKLSIPNVRTYLIYTWLDTNSLKENDIISSYVYVGGTLDGLEKRTEEAKAKLKSAKVPVGELVGGDVTWYCAGTDVLYNYDLLQYFGISDVQNGDANASMYSIKLILMMIIILGGGALIANGFVISISERNKYIGLLASVGATKRQKRSSVYFEGFFEGIIAIPIGILIGVGGIGILFELISPLVKNLSGRDTELELVMNSNIIISTIIYSVLIIFISARTPAKMASKISPIDAIRQNKDVKLTRKQVKTMGITKKIFGFEGELALKNLKRNKKRYSITVFSMCVSLTLFISVYSVIHYVKESFCLGMQDIVCDMQIYGAVYSEAELEEGETLEYTEDFEEVTDKILSLGEKYIEKHSRYEEISGGKAFHYVDICIEENMLHEDYDEYLKKYKQSAQGIQLFFVTMNEADLRSYLKSIDIDYNEFVEDIDNVILYDDIYREDGLHNQYVYSGATISEKIKKLPYRYVRVEVNSEYVENDSIKDKYVENVLESGEFNVFAREEKFLGLQIYDSYVLVTPQKATQLKEFGYASYGYLALDVNNDKKIEEIYGQIIEENAEYADLFEMSNFTENVKQTEDAMTLVSILVYGFIILITLICVANIINTISTSVALRRREFAMLKSVGMTDKQFNRMIVYESMFYGLKAILYGFPLGIGVSLNVRYLMREEYVVDFSRPWAGYLIAIISVFVVIGLTMFYSSRRIKKANIIEALRDENA